MGIFGQVRGEPARQSQASGPDLHESGPRVGDRLDSLQRRPQNLVRGRNKMVASAGGTTRKARGRSTALNKTSSVPTTQSRAPLCSTDQASLRSTLIRCASKHSVTTSGCESGRDLFPKIATTPHLACSPASSAEHGSACVLMCKDDRSLECKRGTVTKSPVRTM